MNMQPASNEDVPGAAAASHERARLSAFVISYNREAIIGTVLRAISFADEIVVIDKSSSDRTAEIAAGLADRVIVVPWSPTVEETRAFAIAQCSHDWILCLDDDECLSAAAARFIHDELAAPRAGIYSIPLRHYIIARHSEQAYYWPEAHRRLFRRGAMDVRDRVHAGLTPRSDRIHEIPIESGVCIHHLSHRSVHEWIEKTNRYTSRPDRARVAHPGRDLAAFAHERIDVWLARTRDLEPDGYPVAVAIQRAIYDLIDRLKTWEEEGAVDGDEAFAAVCRALEADYAQQLPDLARPRAGTEPRRAAAGAPASPPAVGLPDNRLADAVRFAIQALREQADAMRSDSDRALSAAKASLAAREEALNDASAALGQRTAERDAALDQLCATADQLRQARDRLSDRDAALAATAAELADRSAELASCSARLASCSAELASRLSELDALMRQRDALREEIGALRRSTSWRLTGPIRSLAIRLRHAPGTRPK